ncbi:MAG: hypothetical protein O3A01_08350 [bacterium]|nr:hypothetical protein [bacterium]
MKPQHRRHFAYALLQSLTNEPLTLLYDFDKKSYFSFGMNNRQRPASFYDFESNEYLRISTTKKGLIYTRLSDGIAIAVALNKQMAFAANISKSNYGIKGLVRHHALTIYDEETKKYHHYRARP